METSKSFLLTLVALVTMMAGTWAQTTVQVQSTTDRRGYEFTMPDDDVVAEYEVVRNIANNTTVSLIINDKVVKNDTYIRIRRNSETNKYEIVDNLTCRFTDDVKTDANDKNIVINVEGFAAAGLKLVFLRKGEGNSFSILDEDDIDKNTGLPADLDVDQTYCVTLMATANSPHYGGITNPSVTLTLAEGYPMTIPAKHYATYYNNMALTLSEDMDDVKLFTITEVSQESVTITEIRSANARMPFLVYNSSDQPVDILLVPTIDDEKNVTVAPEFKGTSTAKEMPASSDQISYRVLKNNAFVKVNKAGTIAAHHCWIEQPVESAARELRIVSESPTDIDYSPFAIDHSAGDIYDLNGRQMVNGTLRKGVYVQKGKKIIK